MNIKYLSVFLVASLLVLTACQDGTPTPTAGQAFIGGTNGLEVVFEPISVQENNIYSIFDDEEFPLEITIRNKGEEIIKKNDVTLTLLGPAQGDFSGISSWEKRNNEKLEKISEFNPDGGEETISFATKAKYKKDVVGALDLTWNLNYQYKYKTHLIINDVCFKEDLRDPRVCTLEGPKTFSVSSAPITVTSVREDTAGKGLIALTIGLKNMGGGTSTIIGQDFDQRFNQIGFKVDEPKKWECKSGGRENQGRIDKTAATATIRCKLKTSLKEGELYSSPVGLTLEYMYQNLIKENMRIKESQK